MNVMVAVVALPGEELRDEHLAAITVCQRKLGSWTSRSPACKSGFLPEEKEISNKYLNDTIFIKKFAKDLIQYSNEYIQWIYLHINLLKIKTTWNSHFKFTAANPHIAKKLSNMKSFFWWLLYSDH